MKGPSDPNSLPISLQVIGFALSLVLAGFKVFEFFRKPTLCVEITRDIFFRLIDEGEALFCGPVLLANNGPILVRTITPTLCKVRGSVTVSGAEKKFPLRVAHVGEKVHGEKLLADFKFFGSTPLQYLAPSQPYRAVYVCFQAEYQERQRRAVAEFANALVQFKQDRQALSEEHKEEILADFDRLIENQFHKMISLIQLEGGDYELEVEFTYECIGWRFWGSEKRTRAKLSFKLAEADIARWKLALKDILILRGRQIMTDKIESITYPELTPFDIEER